MLTYIKPSFSLWCHQCTSFNNLTATGVFCWHFTSHRCLPPSHSCWLHAKFKCCCLWEMQCLLQSVTMQHSIATVSSDNSAITTHLNIVGPRQKYKQWQWQSMWNHNHNAYNLCSCCTVLKIFTITCQLMLCY